jgi:MFS family permease
MLRQLPLSRGGSCKKKGVAVGIVFSGLGLGTLIFSSLSEALIAHFEWRGATVFLGFTILALYFVGVLVIRRDPSEMGLVPLGEKPNTVNLGVSREAGHAGEENAETLL